MSKLVTGVIFDLDGTLIDSKSVMRDAYFAAYDAVVGDSSPPAFSEYCRYLGQSFPTILEKLGLPIEMMEIFVRESSLNIGKIILFDGVLDVLNELSRLGVPLAIATGKDHERATSILEHLNISHYFQMVVGSDDVPRQKPAPDMALCIVDRLNLQQSETLFVGDAVADLTCGRSAGLKTALALWDNPEQAVLREKADFHLNHPKDILMLL